MMLRLSRHCNLRLNFSSQLTRRRLGGVPSKEAPNSASSRTFGKDVAMTLTGIGLFGYTYLAADEKRLRDATRVAASVRRMASLSGTVFLICADYGSVMFSQRGILSPQDIAAEELQISNTEFEQLITRREAGETSLTDAIAAARSRVLRAGEHMATLMSDPTSSPYHEVHLRSALRLRTLCEVNKGVYIKLGQHLGQLDYLLPPEYIDTLKTMFANNPVSPTEFILRVIEEDTGRTADQLWANFNPVPIASASLAQVHVATGSDGRRYAVKVQHEGLLEASKGDLIAITVLANIVSWLFKDFDYGWLVKEINFNLPRELDFRLEAQNAHRAAGLLQGDDVVIPDVYIATPRVLCMSFEEGCFVSNTAELQRNDIRCGDVARLISKTFSEQMFIHGFVHCDPHIGNLLVRPHPQHPGKPQLVLLDHGLYRDLTEDFRRSYTRLWAALLSSNVPDIAKYCEELNVGGAYPLMASVLTFRSWDDITSKDLARFNNKGTNTESEVLRGYAHKYIGEIIKLLGEVPADLLLVLKTNDCLRHLDKALGAPVNSAIVISLTTSRVIFQEDWREAKSWGEKLTAVVKFADIRLKANCYIAASWVLSIWTAFDWYIKNSVFYSYLYYPTAEA